MFKFSFFQTNRPVAPSAPLFDEPFLRRLERLSYQTPRYLRGGQIGEQRSQKLRPAVDFSDHRPYAAGDDFRHIDWNASARHEQLSVKLGEATQSVDLHVLLDNSPSMGWTDNPDQAEQSSKWDGARRLAGALAYLGLADGERVRLTPFAGNLAEPFGPVRGKRQVVPLFNTLSQTEVTTPYSTSREVDFAISLRDYARRHPQGGLLILLSDLLDTVTDDETAMNFAQGLRYLPPPRWQVVVIHLLTAQELAPDLSGSLELRDLETGDVLPFQFDGDTLAQYRLRVQRWSRTLQRACAQRRASYAQILADWPLERKVIPYLRQRGITH